MKQVPRNLEFFTEISFNSVDLTTLRTNIKNLVNNYKITSNNISGYLSNQIYDLVKNINTVSNGSLEQYVAEPTYSSNSIIISLKSDIGSYKFKSTSLGDIVITSNQISLNAMTLYTPPEPSPINWFTWNNTQITGLSELGRQQERIVLPSLATSVSSNAFNSYGLKSNKMKYLDMSFTKITSIPNGINSSTELFLFYSKVEEIILPSTLTSIGNWAFYTGGYDNLRNIIIPPSVTHIGESAFNGTKIESIELPDKINVISQNAFYSCTMLSSVNIPNSVTTIGVGAFRYCSNLTSITIPNSVTTIRDSAFASCRKLKSINIPNSITRINCNTFNGCSMLDNLIIPNSVTTIEDLAFAECRSLKSIKLSSNLKSINAQVFNNCIALRTITFPNGLNILGKWAFVGCVSLETITIPNSVTSIGKWCFTKNENNYPSLPNLIIYVNSTNVEQLVKSSLFTGFVFNLSNPTKFLKSS